MKTSVLRKLVIHNMTDFHLKCHQHFKAFPFTNIQISVTKRFQTVVILYLKVHYILKYSSIILTKNLMIAQQKIKNSALQENFHAVQCDQKFSGDSKSLLLWSL